MRVHVDQVDYLDCHRHFYEGVLFTGTAYELFPDGALRCEIEFKDGLEHGKATDYYPSGQLAEVRPYKNGRTHGDEMKWSESGILQERNQFIMGVLMKAESLNESGSLALSFERPEDDPLYRLAMNASISE